MAGNIPFQPTGKTVQITTNAATPTNKTVTSDSPVQQYMLVNHASQPVYIWLSLSTAPVNVAVPNATTAQYALVIPPATVKVVTGPPINQSSTIQASAIAESGTPDIYITPGEGF